MNKLFLYPYKGGSKSAKGLAEALGGRRIKLKGSKFNPRNKTIINWGSSALPQDYIDKAARVINHPMAIKRASNKLQAFQALEGNVPLPEWTTSREEAAQWLLNGASAVFCRTKLTGNSGQGIVLASNTDELVDAPLYTKWCRIDQEYRIHVFNGEVLDMQRKARKRDVPDDKVNWKIRNHDNGFIFARGDCNPPQEVIRESVKAVNTLGLDFGAVDVIFTKTGEVKILEINTACGLTGTTLENYTNKFKELTNA